MALTFLDVHFVSAQDNGDVLNDPDQVPVQVRNVLVRHARCDVKHNDATLSLNVVTVSKAAKLLLSSSIADIETDRSSVCIGDEGANFNTECSHVLLLELTRQEALYKRRLSSTAVSDQN